MCVGVEGKYPKRPTDGPSQRCWMQISEGQAQITQFKASYWRETISRGGAGAGEHSLVMLMRTNVSAAGINRTAGL